MKIPEKTVADVVAEASKKMSEPNYSAVMVSGFVQTQRATAQYLTAHARELGGSEGVVHAVFHSALLALCYQRAHNRTVRALTFEDLDRGASGDPEARLRTSQPHLLDYIVTNVELPAMREILITLALAMDWAT
ncbi:MAG TPA: hypothetical protein VL172_15120 [Kofleriaceae bacterium]|nr:hypothetical protein [Kofleriaceae bacterium]